MGTRLCRKSLIAAAVALGLFMARGVVRGDPSWSGPATLNIPTAISSSGQSVSSSINLTLNHDVSGCTVYFTATGDGYLLKSGAFSLTTAYKLTGAVLDHQDSVWVSAYQFAQVANTYAVTGTGTSDLTLWVQATEPGGVPVPAGTYTATLTATVTWP